jgi:NAD(P)-dependent dehydrogenase (short-subunit alcohol dehydrogenase family)
MDGTAVVTGASSGIGRAVTAALAEAGMTVVGCARDDERLQAAVEAVGAEAEGTVVGVRADVRDEFDVERLLERAAREGESGVDLVVANAGVYHGEAGQTPIDDESYSAFDDHVRTNVRGVFATLREAIPHLTESGRMLVTTGPVARNPTAGVGSYAVSKAGAEAVMRQFAADTDAVVGCVDPGQVNTDLSGGPGRDPEEVAEMFVWAADHDAEAVDGEVLDLRAWRSATR